MSLPVVAEGGISPQITSTSAGTLSLSGATLSWITNQPQYSPYSCYANYGLTTGYGSTTPATAAGIVGVTGLASGTLYHYQVNCSNGTASTTSPDATFTTLSSIPYNVPRTVIDNEGGMIYSTEVAKPGINIQAPFTTTGFTSANMDPLAIKVNHSLFHMGGAPDQHKEFFYPGDELSAFNAEELAAGRAGILVTAPYGGSHYPVMSSCCTNNGWSAKQLAFLSDPRYVRFMVQEWARKTLMTPTYPDTNIAPYYPTAWASSDEGSFELGDFAIYPNGNTSPVAAGTWDPPFPQNEAQFYNSVQGFLYQMHQFAPDVHLMINAGMSASNGEPISRTGDVASYANFWGLFDGIDEETFWSVGTGATEAYTQEQVWDDMQDWQWSAATGQPLMGRVVLTTSNSPGTTYQIQTAAIAYLMIRDGNTFLAVQDTSGNQVAPSSYTPIFDALGAPTGLYSTIQNGSEYYQAVYMRTFQGGIALFNYSGSTYTYTLPATLNGVAVGAWYLNNSGPALSPGQTVTVNDDAASASGYAGIYLTTQQGTFAAVPAMYPPTQGKALTGPVAVTISDTTAGAVIHYTTDGSAPSCNSLTYTSAIILSSNATVRAVACASGDITSWVKTMTYQVTSTAPAVQMALASDAAPPFYATTSAPVALSNPSAAAVSVHYTVSAESGVTVSPGSGTVTFQPYETAKAIIITASLSPGQSAKSVTITLSSPANATLGTQTAYVYTIQPDSVPSLQQFVNLHPSANAGLSSSSPSIPYAPTSSSYWTGHDSSAGNFRTLWQFDLSSIPSGATVLSAQLKFYSPQGVFASNPVNVSAYRMLTNWTQSGATWNNSGGISSNYAAAASDTENVDIPSINNPASSINLYWDVTSDVKAFLSGAEPNYGWVMIGPEAAGSSNKIKWYGNGFTDENGNHVWGAAASLLVTYTVPEGTAPPVTLQPAGLSFGTQWVGVPSGSQALTLSNSSGAALSIASIAVSGTNAADFSITSDNCGNSLAAGANCTVAINFTPGAAGARSASLVVTDTASGSPETAALSGTGVTATAVLNPASLLFGKQTVGAASAAQTVTLSNSGNAALSIASIAMSGPNAADFNIASNDCGSSLAAGANCSLAIRFTPGAAGVRSASLVVTDTGAGSPQVSVQTSQMLGTGSAAGLQTVAGALQQVSVGADGTVWGLNDGSIYFYDNQSQQWQQAPGSLAQIAVGSSAAVWGLNSAGGIYRWDTKTESWDAIPGNLAQIAVGWDGDAWGINGFAQVYHFNRQTQGWEEIPGSLQQIAVGFAGAVWGVNSSNQAFRFDPGSAAFEQLPGRLTRVAVGADGDAWGLGSGNIYHFNQMTQNWDSIPGELAQITVGAASNVWGLDASGQIYEYDQKSGSWAEIAGTLSQISAGANGAVWGLDSARAIYQCNCGTPSGEQAAGSLPGTLAEMAVGWDGSTWALTHTHEIYTYSQLGQSWVRVPGELAQIAVGSGESVWGLNSVNQIFRYNPANGGWDWIDGSLTQIAVGVNGDVWGINAADQIFRFDAAAQSWSWIPGSLRQISIGADGSVWGLNWADQIFSWNERSHDWTWVPGALAQITVGSSGNVWGINPEGSVYRFDAPSESWSYVPGMSLLQIAAGFDGSVWGMDATHQVFEFDSQSQSWTPVLGGVRQMLAASGTIEGLNFAGSVYRYW